MIKINTFSMPFRKTYCLFHFQTEIFFFIFFSYGQYLAPEKNAICLRILLRTFPMELKYPETIKEIINGIYYRFSQKFGLKYRSQPVFSHLYPFLAHLSQRLTVSL